MYLGRMVESGSCESVYAAPKRPYTQVLRSAMPREHPDQVRERIVLQGSIPNPAVPPSTAVAVGEYVSCRHYR